MAKIFIADYANKVVREKATMEEPFGTFKSEIHYYNCRYEYTQHLASLKSYPATWLTPEMDGKELVEGVDFKLKHQCISIDYTKPDEWVDCSKFHYECMQERYRRIIALPSKPEQDDAIDFAEWIGKNNYQRNMHGWFYSALKAREQPVYYSSRELYKLFKQKQ